MLRAAHAPYFLDIAKDVGHKPSDPIIPVIFSLTAVTSVIGIFTAPYLMNKLGIKTVVGLSSLLDGVLMCTYGMLDVISNRALFDSVAITVRILQGITQSLANASTQTAAGILYMDRLDFAMGVYRSSHGVGYLIAGLSCYGLYQLSGFLSIYMFFGSISILMGILTFFILPTDYMTETERCE